MWKHLSRKRCAVVAISVSLVLVFFSYFLFLFLYSYLFLSFEVDGMSLPFNYPYRYRFPIALFFSLFIVFCRFLFLPLKRSSIVFSLSFCASCLATLLSGNTFVSQHFCLATFVTLSFSFPSCSDDAEDRERRGVRYHERRGRRDEDVPIERARLHERADRDARRKVQKGNGAAFEGRLQNTATSIRLFSFLLLPLLLFFFFVV